MPGANRVPFSRFVLLAPLPKYLIFHARMGGRAVEGTGLENRQGLAPLVGSNPTPSAIPADGAAVRGISGEGWCEWGRLAVGGDDVARSARSLSFEHDTDPTGAA